MEGIITSAILISIIALTTAWQGERIPDFKDDAGVKVNIEFVDTFQARLGFSFEKKKIIMQQRSGL